MTGESGDVVSITGNPVTENLGVRPALILDLSKVVFSSVILSGGVNATVSGGTINQHYFDYGTTRSKMTDVTYTANSGYKFPPTSDYYKTTNEITVTRTSDTVITVSGTPTDNLVNITVPDAHMHDFNYNVSIDTITATCNNKNCYLTGQKTTLTIVAPTLTTYGGTGSATAKLTGCNDFNSATGKTIAETDISYVGREGTSYVVSATAPTSAGKYTAKITVEGKTASVDYEIARVAPTVTAPTAKTLTYTGQALELVNTGSTKDGILYYAMTTENTAPTDENRYNTESVNPMLLAKDYVIFSPNNNENKR